MTMLLRFFVISWDRNSVPKLRRLWARRQRFDLRCRKFFIFQTGRGPKVSSCNAINPSDGHGALVKALLLQRHEIHIVFICPLGCWSR